MMWIFLSACSANDGTADPHQAASAGGSGGSAFTTGGTSAGTAGKSSAGSGGAIGSSSGGSSAGGSSSGGSSGGSSTAGSSASGGTGGYLPTTIADCNNLPAPGTWEDASPEAFKNPSNMETWSVVLGIQDQRIYAAAGNVTNFGGCPQGQTCPSGGTGVLETTDCGATWTAKTTGENSDKLLTGDPWAMLIDPGNPDVIYMNNGYGSDPTLYKSTNAGVDWTALWPHPVWKQTSHVQAIAM
ncbi:MAG TPA: hypothetical protein VGP93_15030, partial [Polyangiaceae bacterium]|nr:hypothetical protein [Polyangiaceae bacterium]